MEVPSTTLPSLTATPGVLTVGAGIPFRPLRHFDAGGGVAGFEADLVAAMAERLELEVVWIPSDPDTLMADLLLGRFDVIAPSSPLDPEDVAAVRTTGAYYRLTGSDARLVFAVDPARSELAVRFDDALAALVADGAYQAIYDRWLDDPTSSVLHVAPAAEIGDPGRPIRLVFVPMVPIAEIRDSARDLIPALTAATGLSFEVTVPGTYREAIEAICALPEESVGILSAPALVVADDLCGVSPALVATRLGSAATWSEFVVSRDSTFTTLEDLAGRTWVRPGMGSPTGELVPTGMLAVAGVTTGAVTVVDSHAAAVRAVLAGEADFATVFFRPATDRDGTPQWDGTPENADVPEDIVWSCATISTGEVVCAEGLRPRDARITIREEARDVMQRLRILTVSDPIPNEVVAFAPGFPPDRRAAIVSALHTLARDDPQAFGKGFAAYAWDGVVAADAVTFEGLRTILAALGFGIDDL